MANALIASRDKFCLQYPEKRQSVNGREWGVLRVGESGPALVLIPGTLGRSDIFWQQINALRDRARILAVSYPKTGSIEAWASDICELLDSNNMETATILGSSLGGYLAQYLAGVHADRFDNLIAANTLHSVGMLGNIPPYNMDMDATSIKTLRQGFNDGLKKTRDEEPHNTELIELLLLEVTGRIPEPELRMRLNALKFGPELPPAGLTKDKTYTVESDDDRLIPPVVRDAVRARLDPVESFNFAKGTHFPYVTHPQEYTSMLEAILGLTK